MTNSSRLEGMIDDFISYVSFYDTKGMLARKSLREAIQNIINEVRKEITEDNSQINNEELLEADHEIWQKSKNFL